MQCAKALRSEFLLDPEVVYLNHGSFGATPKVVFEKYQFWQRELEKNPADFLARRCEGLLAQARQDLASYLGTAPNNLVFYCNATMALNSVARSLKLGPGDQVLATNHEYGALDLTWKFLATKQGFLYKNQNISVPFTTKEKLCEEFWAGASKKTKVVFISQVTSPTAAIFPVKEICAEAKRRGIISVVDGAHVPGQLDLNLDQLGADFYAGNLHKWLCAPKGAAFLYANSAAQALSEPLTVSWGWGEEVPQISKFIDHHQWQGTRDIAAFLAVSEAIDFLRQKNWPELVARCKQLLIAAEKKILDLTKQQTLYENHDFFAQLLAARLPPGTDVAKLALKLWQKYKIEVICHEWNQVPLIRISAQGYTTQPEIDCLVQALHCEL